VKILFGILGFLSLACGHVTAQDKPTPVCPTFRVLGPPSLTIPGGVFTFTAEFAGEVPKNVSYRWSVSEGTIASGQGTPSIQLLAPKGNSYITAIVELVGLPETCTNFFSETAAAVCSCDPLLENEYGKLSFAEEKHRLASAVEAAKRIGATKIYIIKYFPKRKRRNDARIAKIKSYLSNVKRLPKNSFVVVLGPYIGRYNTKIYLSALGSNEPVP